MSQVLLQLYGNSSWCLKLTSLSSQPLISLHYTIAGSPLHCPYCSFQEDTETAASKKFSQSHTQWWKKLLFPEVSSLDPRSPQLIWQVLECLCPQLKKAGNTEGTGTFQGLGYKHVSCTAGGTRQMQKTEELDPKHWGNKSLRSLWSSS